MSENPYQSPRAVEEAAVGVLSGSRDDLRKVAKYQKGVILSLLATILSAVAVGGLRGAVADAPNLVLGILILVMALVYFGAAIAGTVFVFLLALKVYGTGAGVLFGIAALIPCVGLLALLRINAKATSVLKQNGIRVGFLGANPAEI